MTMSSAGVQAVQALYKAFATGDIGTVLGALSPDIVWNEAENFPYADGNPYHGPQAVAAGVFARLGGEWEGFTVHVEEILDAGDVIVARGRYRGIFKKTGKGIDAQMAHIWTVADGKFVKFQQHVDTLQVARAMER
jgi:ketosteroid isomerase-like protein